MQLILFVGIALLSMFLLTVDGSAKTITVDDDGGADYTKIQDAINASVDGDTIKVWEGTYFENVVLNRTLSFIGNGSEETSINGEGSGTVVNITADWCNISGFEVSGSGNNDTDAGVKVTSHHNNISDNSVSFNDGYGIYLTSSDGNTVCNNNASSNRLGIYLSSSRNCIIENNICLFFIDFNIVVCIRFKNSVNCNFISGI